MARKSVSSGKRAQTEKNNAEKEFVSRDFGAAEIVEFSAYLLLAAAVIFIPLIFSRTTKSNFILPKELIWQPIVGAAALLWGISIIIGGRVTISRSRSFAFLALFLSLCLISSFNGLVPYESMLSIRALFAAALGGFLIANLAGTRIRVLVMIIGISVIGCIEAMWGSAQRLGATVVFKVGKEAVGTLGNSNYLGGYVGLLLPVVIGVGFAALSRISGSSKRIAIMAAFLYMICPLLAGLVLSECQGAYLSTGGALILMAIVWAAARRGKLKLLAGGAVLSMLIIAITIAAISFLGKIPLNKFTYLGEKAVGGRVLMWEASLEMVAAHPVLGIGVGNYQYNYLKYLGKAVQKQDILKIKNIIQNDEKAHNMYIQYWAEAGTLGILAFLAMLGIFFWDRLKISLKIQDQFDFWMHLGISAGFAGLCALLFVSSLMVIAPMREFFFIFMGLVIAWERAIKEPEKPDYTFSIPEEWGAAKSAAIIMAIALPAAWTLSAADLSSRRYRANELWKQGMLYTDASRMDKSIAKYDEALKLTPRDMKLMFYRGSAMIKYSESFKGKQSEEVINDGLNNLLEARQGYSDINLDSNIGKGYNDLGRLDESARYYGYAAESGLKYADTHTNYAAALQLAGKYEEARVELEKALKVDKNNVKSRYYMGMVMLRLNRNAEAEENLKIVAGTTSKNADVIYHLGLSIYNQGRYADSLEYFKRVKLLKPKDTKNLNLLAGSLYSIGKKEEALTQWREVLEIAPSDETAKKNIEMHAGEVGK